MRCLLTRSADRKEWDQMSSGQNGSWFSLRGRWTRGLGGAGGALLLLLCLPASALADSQSPIDAVRSFVAQAVGELGRALDGVRLQQTAEECLCDVVIPTPTASPSGTATVTPTPTPTPTPTVT